MESRAQKVDRLSTRHVLNGAWGWRSTRVKMGRNDTIGKRGQRTTMAAKQMPLHAKGRGRMVCACGTCFLGVTLLLTGAAAKASVIVVCQEGQLVDGLESHNGRSVGLQRWEEGLDGTDGVLGGVASGFDGGDVSQRRQVVLVRLIRGRFLRGGMLRRRRRTGEINIVGGRY